MFYMSFRKKISLSANALIEFFCIWFFLWTVITAIGALLWRLGLPYFDNNHQTVDFFSFLSAVTIKFLAFRGREVNRRFIAKIHSEGSVGASLLFDIKNNYDQLKMEMHNAVTFDANGNISRDRRRFVVRKFVRTNRDRHMIFELFTATEGVRYLEAAIKECETLFKIKA